MKRLAWLVAVGSVACGARLASAELLTNGNLDRTHAVEIVPAFFLPQPSNWVNSAFKTKSGPYKDDLSSEAWAGPAPTPVTTDGNANLPPPEGFGGPDGGVFFKAFSGNLANGDLATGNLYQDVPGTPGQTYVLTGWAGAEPNYSGLIAGGQTKSQFAIEFLNGANTLIGGTILDLAAAGLGTANGQPFNYKKYSLTGVAPAGTATVRARVSMIDGYSNPLGGAQAFVVDDFSLNVVPEPAGLALGLLGLVGLVRPRRKR